MTLTDVTRTKLKSKEEIDRELAVVLGQGSFQRVVSWRRWVRQFNHGGKIAEFDVTFFGWITFGIGWAIRYAPGAKRFKTVWQRYDSGKELNAQLHIGRLRIGILRARIAS